MIKPLGVLLVLVVVIFMLLSVFVSLWKLARFLRRGERMKAALLGIAAAAVAVMCAWAIHAVAPKGGRTIAELQFPDKREFVVRHYRYGWFEYPKVRFYARDQDGTWTSFSVISELVDANTLSLVLDATAEQVQVGKAGSYLIQQKDFVNIDGSRGNIWRLPPGIEPGEEDLSAPPLGR